MMPEFSDLQIRMLALDHAVKCYPHGSDADAIILEAKKFEAYLRESQEHREAN